MSSMDANKHKLKIGELVLFAAYLILLFYLVFFSESMGRTGEHQYRYNLTLFREIKRFFVYRKVMGYEPLLLNVVGNVLAFMPFGYFLPKLTRRGENLFFTVLLGFELSLGVELLQLIFKIGCFDVDDLLLNTVGSFLGYLVYFFFTRRKIKRKKSKKPKQENRA